MAASSGLIVFFFLFFLIQIRVFIECRAGLVCFLMISMKNLFFFEIVILADLFKPQNVAMQESCTNLQESCTNLQEGCTNLQESCTNLQER